MPRACVFYDRYWTTCYQAFSYPCGVEGTLWKPWTWRTKWCEGQFPYPCRKTRTVNGWCYDCAYVRRKCYGAFCIAYCCDGGKEYKWYEPAFLRFGEHYSEGATKTSEDQLEEVGPCKPAVEPQPLPSEPGSDPRPGPGPTPPGGVGGVTPG